MGAVDVLRRNVEQFQFEKGDKSDPGAEWGAELDRKINKIAIAKLIDAINEIRSNHSIKDREKQLERKVYLG